MKFNTFFYKILNMRTQMSIKKNPSMLSSQQLSHLQPTPLYRTHKHVCTRCHKRCHIIYELGKTDCICERYVSKNDSITKLS